MLQRFRQTLRRLPGSVATGRLVAANLEVATAMARRQLTAPVPVADAPDAVEIPSVAELGDGDRVLAEIDQDGFAFAVHPADVGYFNRREEKLQKRRYQLEVVLFRGAVCVRKQFGRQDPLAGMKVKFWSLLGLPFATEGAALLRLRQLDCVPRIHHIDLVSRVIYIDYLRAESLQHRLAVGGELLDDPDGPIEVDDPARDQREISAFAAAAPELREGVNDLVAAVNRCGVAPIDVKLGNVLVGEKTGKLYWIDFERAALASFPDYAEALAEHHRRANLWFGLNLSRE